MQIFPRQRPAGCLCSLALHLCSPPNLAESSEKLVATALATYRWLQEQLRQASETGSQVIVAAHHQAGRGGARDTHLAWNWRDIKETLTHAGCVKLYMAGHDHMGGYSFDGGIHWLTVEALLEGIFRKILPLQPSLKCLMCHDTVSIVIAM